MRLLSGKSPELKDVSTAPPPPPPPPTEESQYRRVTHPISPLLLPLTQPACNSAPYRHTFSLLPPAALGTAVVCVGGRNDSRCYTNVIYEVCVGDIG